MNRNDDKKQSRKRGVPAHVKNAEKNVNNSLGETDVNEALVDFDVAANSVQNSDENLVLMMENNQYKMFVMMENNQDQVFVMMENNQDQVFVMMENNQDQVFVILFRQIKLLLVLNIVIW